MAIQKLQPKLTKVRLRLDGSRAIISLFILTVLASSALYLKTELAGFWQKFTSPMVISTLPEEERFDPSPVLEEIEGLTKELRGVYGLYVYRFEDGNGYGWHQKEVFPAASLMKLPVLLTLYQAAERGELSLDAEYSLIQQDKVGGAGILQSKPVGTVYTYRQLAEYMGQCSDNTAYNVLVRIFGREKIQATIDDVGMRKTSFRENETTPEDIGLFFHQLYQGGVVTFEHRQEILKFLTDTVFEDRIPAGVPEGVRVAHKIGTEIGSFSDAGIVFANPPAGGFVLVILSKAAREPEALEILPQITQSVWEFEADN